MMTSLCSAPRRPGGRPPGRAWLALLFGVAFGAAAASQAQESVVTTTTHEEHAASVRLQDRPRIAVADLAYEQKVSEYFYQYSRNADTSHKQSASHDANEHKAGFDAQFSSTESEIAGTTEKMERAELRKFAADVKGELIKTGRYRVSQAKPWLEDESPTIFDITERIKGGQFPDADYVLFGIIDSIDFAAADNPIQGSNSRSRSLSLNLLVEFSLIDTKTHEVVAAFSASGEGQETKLGAASAASFNRSKVIQQASQDLGRNVAHEIQEQFTH